jgi:hypothetical protein
VITIQLPFDLPVRTAARIGAYLQRTIGDNWQIVPGEITEIHGMPEHEKVSHMNRFSWIIEDGMERRRR